ncbi:MAG TPA: amino acid permease, partial [Nitrosarchaeum sp.]|nr:amino acid permease [Nitrosarchaeum sp.]
KIFSKIHKKYKTPYMALAIQGIVAFILSIFGGITELISFSVFNMAIMYIFVCLSLFVLKKEHETKFMGQKILPLLGICICGFLIYFTSVFDKIIGSVFIILGIIIYSVFYRKTKFNSST